MLAVRAFLNGTTRDLIDALYEEAAGIDVSVPSEPLPEDTFAAPPARRRLPQNVGEEELVDEGDRVECGQPLAELDDSPVDSELDTDDLEGTAELNELADELNEIEFTDFVDDVPELTPEQIAELRGEGPTDSTADDEPSPHAEADQDESTLANEALENDSTQSYVV